MESLRRRTEKGTVRQVKTRTPLSSPSHFQQLFKELESLVGQFFLSGPHHHSEALVAEALLGVSTADDRVFRVQVVAEVHVVVPGHEGGLHRVTGEGGGGGELANCTHELARRTGGATGR